MTSSMILLSLNRRQPLISQKLNTELTTYINTCFYLRRNKPHFTPPVQLRVYLSLQACYAQLFTLGEGVFVHRTKLLSKEVGLALHQLLLAVRGAQCSL